MKISTIRYLSLRMVGWYHHVEIVELERQQIECQDAFRLFLGLIS